MIERQTSDLGSISGKELRGVVDRYEGHYAVLVFDDGQRLLWPREQLPAGAKEGVAVVVALTVDLMDTEQRSARLQGLMADISGMTEGTEYLLNKLGQSTSSAG